VEGVHGYVERTCRWILLWARQFLPKYTHPLCLLISINVALWPPHGSHMCFFFEVFRAKFITYFAHCGLLVSMYTAPVFNPKSPHLSKHTHTHTLYSYCMLCTGFAVNKHCFPSLPLTDFFFSKETMACFLYVKSGKVCLYARRESV